MHSLSILGSLMYELKIDDIYRIPYICQTLSAQHSYFDEGIFQQYTMSLYEGSKIPKYKINNQCTCTLKCHAI